MYKVPKFNINAMVPYPHILIIGKRGSGKSCLIRDIINYIKIDRAMVISPKEKHYQFYSKIDIFKESVKTEYNQNSVNTFLEEANNNDNIIIMDDAFIFKQKIDQTLYEVLLNSREHNTTLIYSIQYPIGLSEDIRNNFDYVFLAGDDFVSYKKKLYDHYANMFETFNEFNEIYKKVSEDFGFMVINNKAEINNKVSWYKAGTNNEIYTPLYDEKKYIKSKDCDDKTLYDELSILDKVYEL